MWNSSRVGVRCNLKTMFIQWATQGEMETLFGFADNLAIVSTKRETDHPNARHFEIPRNEPDAECINHCLPNPNDVRKTSWGRDEHAYRRGGIRILDNSEKWGNKPLRARFPMGDIVCSYRFLEKHIRGNFNFCASH